MRDNSSLSHICGMSPAAWMSVILRLCAQRESDRTHTGAFQSLTNAVHLDRLLRRPDDYMQNLFSPGWRLSPISAKGR